MTLNESMGKPFTETMQQKHKSCDIKKSNQV